ncbi:UDP-glucose/GDP-mannose dehydrogenase family protein [Deinococcus sp. LM3]|uniref:UDP-glucose dehydrogenase family protein n=1 Tax=Deinococcus sp. LM3 TaxID=1938608 RepID=UPI0009927F43|nr:UDP-glucose/GDP-mannose dehydrogenase family protein [Deinococcus sp. LM3]OOV12694.1 UDP-glucose 6-dehydrogenase [Deinococcus sp. LM3]
MNHDSMKVAVIGTGYVGLGTAALLAHIGHTVTGIDISQDKIDLLRAGQVPIHEPGLDDLLASVQGRLTWTTSYDSVHEADVIFICVGTPPGPDGTPDLQYVVSAAASIAPHLNGHAQVIVNKSTVPIGTGDYVQRLLEDHAPGYDHERHRVVSNPEFLREGTALQDSLYPDRIVLGGHPDALHLMARLYAPLIEQTFTPPAVAPRPHAYTRPALVTTTLQSAEMIKYAANAFLALKISFANEIAGLCERVGADIEEVATGIGMDTRIGHRFLNAGAGWGGSCFGKDTAGLISAGREHGYDMPILQAAIDVNTRQRQVIIDKLMRQMRTLKGKRVTVLGMAFKPDTDDLRDAPAHDLIARLHQLGATVTAHDPIAMPRAAREWQHLTYREATSIPDALHRADAVIIATEWRDYRDLDWNAHLGGMRTRLIIDARNIIRTPVDAHVEQIGRDAPIGERRTLTT